MRFIGVLELAGASGALRGLAVRELGIAACGGLVLTSLGAIASHVRAGGGSERGVLPGVGLALRRCYVACI